MQLFLDCDGVLANFDKRAMQIFKMHPRQFEDKYGPGVFWMTLRNSPDFFAELEQMEDAHELYSAVLHLNPIILTASPAVANKWAPEQKRRWVKRMYGDTQQVIICKSREKCLHGKPGDVIVDDRSKYQHLWIEMGGIWILHNSAKESIEELKKIGVLE